MAAKESKRAIKRGDRVVARASRLAPVDPGCALCIDPDHPNRQPDCTPCRLSPTQIAFGKAVGTTIPVSS